MPMQNPDVSGGFKLGTLTAAINKIANKWSRVGEMGLFVPKPIQTTVAEIETKNGTLSLIPSSDRGGNGVKNKRDKRVMRTFKVPHILAEDQVLAGEYQDVRAFGSESGLTPVQEAVMDSLERMKANIDLTREWMRMGALKGQIIDGDGSTVLFNLFTEFGIEQKVVDFDLGTATTDVSSKCREVARHIETNIMGDSVTGIRALVSPEFFDALVTHPSVEAAFAGHAAAVQAIGGDNRKGFKFGPITFEEYNASAPDLSGNVHKFVPAGDGRAFPEGTRNTFMEIFAPADYTETVNTRGLPYYARSEPTKMGKGYDMEGQSNPLPMCARPAVLVRIHTST